MVWILYPYTTSRSNNAFGWFRDSFAMYGMDAEVYFWGCEGVSKSDLIDEQGDIVTLDRHNIPDAVMIRGYNSGLSMWFEMKGRKVVNCCKAMEQCRDKMVTAKMLEAAGIPTPVTIDCSENPFARFGSRFIMKMLFGSKGEDVYLVENGEQYEEALADVERKKRERLDFFSQRGGLWTEYGSWPAEVAHGCEVLYQEYIESSCGRDLRVWVVGGQVAGHLLRSNSSSFKSNFARGGNAIPFELPPYAAEIAVAAAECIGLDFAGVDLLFTADGRFTVCEVNGNPGFRTTSIVGGSDIPSAVARLFLNLQRKK